MRFFKGIVKLLETILVLTIPILLFYWFISVINLQFLKPFEALLGSIFMPFLSFIKSYNNFTMMYEGVEIDFTPLVLAAALLATFFVSLGLEKVLDIIESAIIHFKNKSKEIEKVHNNELQRNKYIEELAKNKVTYLTLKFHQKQGSNAYLYANKEDIFGEGLLSTMLNDVIIKSKEYKAKDYKSSDIEKEMYSLIFYSITNAIDYAFYVCNKVEEINREVMDQDKKLYFKISCHCSYTEITAIKDFHIATKILNLSGNNEISVSELFKNKYEALKETTNIVFDSKGIYNIDDQQMEIFSLTVK
jgi:uncharacterized protein YggT (Ycf19 family)